MHNLYYVNNDDNTNSCSSSSSNHNNHIEKIQHLETVFLLSVPYTYTTLDSSQEAFPQKFYRDLTLNKHPTAKCYSS